VPVTREDLVGQYVGHTAPKTKEVLRRAMGGVLFLDEAYYLYRTENERDYGQESIEILLQVMENQREDLVVLAGYKDRMDTFFQANPGMSSRIADRIDFPGYTLEELERIGFLMITQAGYQLSPAACATFHDYLARWREQSRFANARSVHNPVERARLRHASRLLITKPHRCPERTLSCSNQTTSSPAGFSGTPPGNRRPVPVGTGSRSGPRPGPAPVRRRVPPRHPRRSSRPGQRRCTLPGGAARAARPPPARAGHSRREAPDPPARGDPSQSGCVVHRRSPFVPPLVNS
jgi:hypothetical protein